MKANELMIGDWVMVTECVADAHFIDYPDKIESIRDGLVGLESDGLETIIERIAPIPITAEILKKNFTYDSYGFFYFFDDNYLDIKEHTDGLWQVRVDEIMSSLPTWRMFVINVHELQHALRLAGVDITIEL